MEVVVTVKVEGKKSRCNRVEYMASVWGTSGQITGISPIYCKPDASDLIQIDQSFESECQDARRISSGNVGTNDALDHLIYCQYALALPRYDLRARLCVSKIAASSSQF